MHTDTYILFFQQNHQKGKHIHMHKEWKLDVGIDVFVKVTKKEKRRNKTVWRQSEEDP